MDIITIISLLFSFAALIGAYILEGGVFGALLQPTAALIVFGGTIGATATSFPMSALKNIIKIIKKAFSAKKIDRVQILNTFMELSNIARKEGLLALEHELETRDLDDLTKTGIKLVVDGADEDVLRQVLETRVINMEHRHEKGISIFEQAGGYSPTMGIVGTVMGLVHILGNLSDPASLAPKIAVAFIATLYGVGFANLLWLPIANKLKELNIDEVLACNMIIEAIQLLRTGTNPTFMREQLKGYLEDEKEIASQERE